MMPLQELLVIIAGHRRDALQIAAAACKGLPLDKLLAEAERIVHWLYNGELPK